MGARYHDAYPCLVVLIIGWFCSLAQSPSVQLMFGTSKHKFFAWVNSAEGVLNLVLSILLAKRYGIIGVALGTMIPMVLNKVMVQPVYVCRVAEIDYFEYVRRMGRTLGVIIVSLIVPVLLTLRFARPDYKSLAALALVSALAYGFMVLLLEFTPDETQRLERAFLPKTWSLVRTKPVS
jgi:O-antigen/teichoic acid export membrane protein